MTRFQRLPILVLAILVVAASSVSAQNQYIGFVYPAGGQQGTTFPIRLGGQGLLYASDLVVSGEGVSVRLVNYQRVLDNQEMGLLRQQLNQLKKKETTVDDGMAVQMNQYEFPAPIGPGAGPTEVSGPVCPVCAAVNPVGATVCISCNAKLEQPKAPKPGEKEPASDAPLTEKELAKQERATLKREAKLAAKETRAKAKEALGLAATEMGTSTTTGTTTSAGVAPP